MSRSLWAGFFNGVMTLTLHQLFPTVVDNQAGIDPLDLAGHLQTLLALRGGGVGNPSEGCAWTGDINGVWQLHQQAEFAPLVHRCQSRPGLSRAVGL